MAMAIAGTVHRQYPPEMDGKRIDEERISDLATARARELSVRQEKRASALLQQFAGSSGAIDPCLDNGQRRTGVGL
jgi:hypothetical protein